MKRLLWMTVGATASVVGSRWTKRKARAAVRQYAPAQLGRRVADSARAATAEARSAAQETEARLRAQFDRRSPPGA